MAINPDDEHLVDCAETRTMTAPLLEAASELIDQLVRRPTATARGVDPETIRQRVFAALREWYRRTDREELPQTPEDWHDLIVTLFARECSSKNANVFRLRGLVQRILEPEERLYFWAFAFFNKSAREAAKHTLIPRETFRRKITAVLIKLQENFERSFGVHDFELVVDWLAEECTSGDRGKSADADSPGSQKGGNRG